MSVRSFLRRCLSGIPASLLSVLLAATAMTATAAPEGVELEGEAAERIYARLHAAEQAMPIVAVRPSPAPGLYTVEMEDATAYYATADGGFLVAGDLYGVSGAGFANRTEDLRAGRRVEMLAAVAKEDMIVFAPEGETRGVVSVFTDVDCGFCQRLHREVPALNEMGIEVRYLAYPRAGIGSKSADKLVTAWCAEDPRTALTRLKQGRPVEPRSCANPVASQFRLGQRMGVRGTPALFLEDGRMIPGYRPAEALAEEMGLAGGR
ncbi:MAG: DsbC family protein [Gammaproteobacteria bacterium]|nr:DsbC family protein [Gammaproteobacteria bacterium]